MINGNSTEAGGFTTLADTPKIATLSAGTYTLSFKFVSGTISGTSNVVIRNLDTSTSIVDSVYGANTTYTFTLSTETNIGFNLYQLGSGRQYSNYVVNIQLEKGSSKSNYEPYGSKNIYWYIKKLIKNIDNLTVLALQSYNNIKYAFIAKPYDYKGRGNYSVYEVFFTKAKFKTSTMWDTANNINYIFSQADNNHLWVGIDKNSTLEQAQTALNNTPLYYPLTTPIDIEITDTTLISQLEAIYNTAKSYDNVTNIIQENNDLPFILDIKTLKKS